MLRHSFKNLSFSAFLVLIAISCSPAKKSTGQSNTQDINNPTAVAEKNTSCDSDKEALKYSIDFLKAQTVYTRSKQEKALQTLMLKLTQDLKSQVTQNQTLGSFILSAKTAATPVERVKLSAIKNMFIESAMAIMPKALETSMVCHNSTKEMSEEKDSVVNAATDLEFVCLLNPQLSKQAKNKFQDLLVISYRMDEKDTHQTKINLQLINSFFSGAKESENKLVVTSRIDGETVMLADDNIQSQIIKQQKNQLMLRLVEENESLKTHWSAMSDDLQKEIEKLQNTVLNKQLSEKCRSTIAEESK